ncbi:MAG: helix-turn-helix transcriptional regulator [Sphingomonas sp.]
MEMFVVGEPEPAEESESCIIEASQGVSDAGMVLRRAREAGGYSLQDVAAATRIAERFLAAIEASEYATFRAPVYAIGFAKTFARHVGVSEGWVADAVRERIAGERTLSPADHAAQPGWGTRLPMGRAGPRRWGGGL